MTTLRQRLQEADPLRHEAPPDLDAVRRRLQAPVLRVASTDPSVDGRRNALLLVPVSIVAAFGLVWASSGGLLRFEQPLAAQVRFEMRLAEESPAPGLVVAQDAGSRRLVYLHPEPLVGNDDLSHAWVVEDGSSRFAVAVQLLADGAERMRQATTRHQGRPVAILVDGVVMMAPTVRSPIADSAVITGDFSRDEATRIAEGMTPR